MFLNFTLQTFITIFVIFADASLQNYPENQVFYSSTTIVEYNSGSKSLEFSTKLLSKNIEKAIGKRIDEPGFDKLLKQYLENNLRIFINGNLSEISFGGKQKLMKTIRIYYEVENVESQINTIEIKNTMLFREFSSQQNFINIEVGENRRSFICKKDDPVGKANFY